MAVATGKCTCGLLAFTATTDAERNTPGFPPPKILNSFDLAKIEDDDDALIVNVHYFDGRPCARYDRSARMKPEWAKQAGIEKP